jgi:CheY-like chemotaxis protein
MSQRHGVRDKRILAVENNDLVLSFLVDVLIADGYQVDTATNGREALEKIDRAPYDLIISDVRMPEVDGAELCRGLAARDAEAAARLVFLAGFSSRQRDLPRRERCTGPDQARRAGGAPLARRAHDGSHRGARSELTGSRRRASASGPRDRTR